MKFELLLMVCVFDVTYHSDLIDHGNFLIEMLLSNVFLVNVEYVLLCNY